MSAGTIFSALLNWLALATGDEAKGGDDLELTFPTPEHALGFMDTAGQKPNSRVCCAFGDNTGLALAEFGAGKHEFTTGLDRLVGTGLADGGGPVGYIYTARGGFIDLGHVRDYIDYTRFFTARYRDAAKLRVHAQGMALFNSEGTQSRLVADQSVSTIDHAESALIGARLAFAHSVWHEIYSYFTVTEKFSAFSPEDLFSNALGVLVGYQALLHNSLPFDAAVDQVLKALIDKLGPVDKAVTDEAIGYIKDHWWESPLVGKDSVRRRNILEDGPVRPWLVTDLHSAARPAPASLQALGKPRAASIVLPTTYRGINIENRAHIVFGSPMQEVANLMPPGMTEITSLNLVQICDALRAHVLQAEGPGADQPD